MKYKFKHITITLLWVICGFVLQAQTVSDSSANTVVIKEKKGSIFAGKPGKAMVMSLIIPGAGQIYNKSYLRLPFVYAAVGGMGWVMVYNVQQYNCLKDAYIASIDGTPLVLPAHCDDRIANITDPAQLRILRDQANADRQLAIIGFALVWLAQGIDAYVDAHLKEFNMSDDLSFEFGAKSFNDPYASLRVGLYVNF